MEVQSSPAEWPELHAFWGALRGRCRRPEGREALERDTTGLLTALPTTNGDTMAQAVPGTRAQRVQECLTTMPWDEEDRTRQRVHKMRAEATTGDGVLVGDETGVPQPGTASVGVARPYAGPLGQVGHGQVAVTCGSSDGRATWPVAVRLYRPQTWAQAPAVSVQTKPEIALALLDQARAWGGPPRGVVAEADEGDHPNCLAGLEARQAPYGVAVRADFPVCGGGAAASPVWRTEELVQSLPRWPWRTVRWRRGTIGWRRQKVVAVRGWRVTRDGHRHEGWLVGERAPQGQPEDRTEFWSHRPADTPLEALAGYAHRRHALEPFQEEAKGEWGWDQYQGRLWPGCHRHAVTVRLAYSFLGWLERQPRHQHTTQGRRRDPVSPAADVSAQDTAGRAS